MRPEFGLDDVVEGGLALADALIEVPDDHLWILPLRGAGRAPREFLASPGWSCTMARLRREFDLVLVDGSPMFTGLSAAVLHRSVDAAVLVHNRSMTGERSLLRAREVLTPAAFPCSGWPRRSCRVESRVYEDHYGLDPRPFGETVSPAAYVALPSRDATLRRLRYGLEHGRALPCSSVPPDQARR